MYTPIIKIEWYVQIIPHSSKKIKYHRSYLVNLATCNIPAAELTSHPHLGGDDNANLIGTTAAMCRAQYL